MWGGPPGPQPTPWSASAGRGRPRRTGGSAAHCCCASSNCCTAGVQFTDRSAMMSHAHRIALSVTGSLLALAALYAATNEPNSQPNPYRTVENWFKLPEGRTWGSTTALDFDRAGTIYVPHPCPPNYSPAT